MYDCVYPTRTARFGTALVPEVMFLVFFLEICKQNFENTVKTKSSCGSSCRCLHAL